MRRALVKSRKGNTIIYDIVAYKRLMKMLTNYHPSMVSDCIPIGNDIYVTSSKYKLN